jgi:hypothetical protein
MTYKIIFTASFYYACGAQPLHLGVSHHGAIKWAVAPVPPTSSHMISLYPSTPFPTTEKKERENREIDLAR